MTLIISYFQIYPSLLFIIYFDLLLDFSIQRLIQEHGC